MAQPKKRLSATRSNRRRSHLHIDPQTVAVCTNCSAANAPHLVCSQCGFYKGKLVLPNKAK